MEWNRKKGMEWIYTCHILVWEFDGGREERFSAFVWELMANNGMER